MGLSEKTGLSKKNRGDWEFLTKLRIASLLSKQTKLRYLCFRVETSAQNKKSLCFKTLKKNRGAVFLTQGCFFLKYHKNPSIFVESILAILPFFAQKVNLIPIVGGTLRRVSVCGQRF